MERAPQTKSCPSRSRSSASSEFGSRSACAAGAFMPAGIWSGRSAQDQYEMWARIGSIAVSAQRSQARARTRVAGSAG